MRTMQQIDDIAQRRFASVEFRDLMLRIQRDVQDGIRAAAVARWERLLQGPPKPDAVLMYPRFGPTGPDLEELRRGAWFKAKNRAYEAARREALEMWRY